MYRVKLSFTDFHFNRKNFKRYYEKYYNKLVMKYKDQVIPDELNKDLELHEKILSLESILDARYIAQEKIKVKLSIDCFKVKHLQLLINKLNFIRPMLKAAN